MRGRIIRPYEKKSGTFSAFLKSFKNQILEKLHLQTVDVVKQKKICSVAKGMQWGICTTQTKLLRTRLDKVFEHYQQKLNIKLFW